MVKKNKIERGISNKILYTLIVIGILAIIGVGVYAVAPNPGHSAEQVSGVCLSNGTGCLNSSSQWLSSGNNIYYNNGNVGIGTSSPTAKLSVNGNLNVSTNISTSKIYLKQGSNSYPITFRVPSVSFVSCTSTCATLGGNSTCMSRITINGDTKNCNRNDFPDSGDHCLCYKP